MDKFTLIVTLTCLAYLLSSPVKCQQTVNTPCTASMIATFTPCMNYITGSSANGSSPTSNCCDAFKSVMSNSVDCGCLLLTAGIPLPQLGNNTMALGLTRFCKGVTVPVQCQASGIPLPAPGPPQFGAPPPPPKAPSSATTPTSPKGPQQFGVPPPSSAFSPQASKATAATPIAGPPAPQDQLPPAAAPVDQLAAPPTIHRVRPVLTPSASSPSMTTDFPIIWLIIMGFIMFKL